MQKDLSECKNLTREGKGEERRNPSHRRNAPTSGPVTDVFSTYAVGGSISSIAHYSVKEFIDWCSLSIQSSGVILPCYNDKYHEQHS